MKKLLAILAFSFLILSKVSAGDLKNPGDIMVDFESFSPANCDYQCFENIEKIILIDFPDSFSTIGWMKTFKTGKKYFDMQQWIYDTLKI